MATSWAQRQTEAANLMKLGKGLVAIPLETEDVVMVKDPDYSPTAGYEVGQTDPGVWTRYAGGDAWTAYNV